MSDQLKLIASAGLEFCEFATVANFETRSAQARDLIDMECRFSDVADDGAIEGTAVRFNVIDDYRTMFAPDAFNVRGRIPMLWSHKADQVIGSWSQFDLRSDGLTVKGKLNLKVAKAQEVRAMLADGDISGLSIGFRIMKSEPAANGVRRITRASLHEISVVAFPAVPGSNVSTVRNGLDLSAFTRAVNGAIASLRK